MFETLVDSATQTQLKARLKFHLYRYLREGIVFHRLQNSPVVRNHEPSICDGAIYCGNAEIPNISAASNFNLLHHSHGEVFVSYDVKSIMKKVNR